VTVTCLAHGSAHFVLPKRMPQEGKQDVSESLRKHTAHPVVGHHEVGKCCAGARQKERGPRMQGVQQESNGSP